MNNPRNDLPAERPIFELASRRAVVVGCLLLVAGFGFTACRQAPPSPVRIGLLLPLSGPIEKNVGRPARYAAQLAVDEVNGRGGLRIDGEMHPVELMIEDSLSDPNHSVEIVRRWIGRGGLTALVGPMLSTTAVPVSAVAESNQLPMITPAASSPLVIADKQWVFRATFSDTVQGWALGQFARRELGPRAAVLFDEATDYGRVLADVFRKSFEQAGGEVVAYEGYVTGETDFGPQLERIHDLQADVLLLPNYIDDLDRQLTQVREVGVEATILGTDSWAPGAFAGAPKADGAIHVVSWHVEAATQEAQPFIDAYRDRVGKDPAGPAALTYDCMGMLFAAIEQGGLVATNIRQQLALTENYQGLTGSFSYHGRNSPGKAIFLLRNEAGTAGAIRQINSHDLGLDEAIVHR